MSDVTPNTPLCAVLTPAQAVAYVTSASAAELNSLSGAPASVSMTTTPASGTCAVQLVFKDAAGNAINHVVAGTAYFSNAAGTAIAAVTSGATLTNGDWLDLAAGKVGHYVTTAAGLLGLTVTASAGSYYLSIRLPNGKVVTTGAIVVN